MNRRFSIDPTTIHGYRRPVSALGASTRSDSSRQLSGFSPLFLSSISLFQSSSNSTMATALFVIDIQNDLATDPSTRIPHSARIKAAGEKILAVARAAKNVPQSGPSTIVFVQHEEKPESGSLVRGSEPWQLVFEPRPGASTERLVAKWTRTSCLKSTDRCCWSLN